MDPVQGVIRQRGTTGRFHWRLGISVLFALFTAGCVMAPALPGGPLQGTALQAEFATAVSYAPGTVTEHFVDGTSKRSRGAGKAGGPMLGRVGGRVGATDWFEVAADYSLADYGAELRGGQPEWSPLPWAVSFSHRAGKGAVLGGHDDHSEWRLRGELYPALSVKRTRRTFLVSALGMSVGNRVQTFDEVSPDFWMLRKETRLEGALGIEFRNKLAVLDLVALPYVVVDHGRTYDLKGQSEVDLDRVFGIAVFLKFGLSFTLERNTGGVRPERAGSERSGLGGTTP